MKRYRGFFIFEIILGMVLLTILALGLSITLRAREKLDNRFGSQEKAIDDAETALLQMQAGQSPGEAVRCEKLGEGPGGRWVRVGGGSGTMELIGLVPGKAGQNR